MADRVHFIWWGNHKGAISIDTPNAVAAALGKGAEVNFWCMSPGTGFSGKLAPGVRVQPIAIDFSTFSGGLADAVTGPTDVLRKLHEYRAYSAVKDLLSLLILRQYGGLYLDTTTGLPPTSTAARLIWGEASAFCGELKKLSSQPKVIVLEAEGQSHRPEYITRTSAVWGDDFSEDFPAYDVPLVDVWAMYSPAGHEFTEAAISSYVKRASLLGITKGGSPTRILAELRQDPEPDPATAGAADYWMRKQDDRFVRNKIIGQLIARSVYDGLFACASKPEATGSEIVEKMGWTAPESPVKDSERVFRHVPALGELRKFYNNSWRGARWCRGAWPRLRRTRNASHQDGA